MLSRNFYLFIFLFFFGLSGEEIFAGRNTSSLAKVSLPELKTEAEAAFRTAWTSADRDILREAITWTPKEKVPEWVAPALEGKDLSIRVAAAQRLAMVGDYRGRALLLDVASGEPPEAKRLNPRERINLFRQLLLRNEAIKALGFFSDSQTGEMLEKLYRDSDGRVRDAAAIALVRRGQSELFEPFLNALQSKETETLRSALEAIEAIGYSQSAVAVFELVRLLSFPDKEISLLSTQIIGKFSPPAVTDEVAVYLDSADVLFRARVIWVLGKMRAKAYRPDYQKNLKNEDGLVRLMSAYALSRCGEEKKEIPIINSALENTDSDVRREALELIEDLDIAPFIPALAKLLAEPAADIRLRAARLILQDEDE